MTVAQQPHHADGDAPGMPEQGTGHSTDLRGDRHDSIPAAQGIREAWKPWFPEDCSMRHIIEIFDGDPCERYRINPKDS